MVGPHKIIRHRRKHWGLKVHGDAHRFHGVGSFCRTHQNYHNPAVHRTCLKRSGAHGRSGTRSEKEYKKRYGSRRRKRFLGIF